MTNTETTTWHLPEENVADAIAKLKRLGERAEKNGLAGGYTWARGGEHRAPVYADSAGEYSTPRFDGQEPAYYEVTVELHVTGTAPRLGGWAFIAQLTWDDGVLVTRTIPGFAGRISDSAIRERACDHCGQHRDRRDCYLLEHEDGRRVQVGSTCVRDFLGHDFKPSWITSRASLEAVEEGFGGRGALAADTMRVLALAASICAQAGWVSVAKAEERYCLSSGQLLRDMLFSNDRRSREAARELEPRPEHRELAAAALAWARTVEPGDSEYLADLRRLAELDVVSSRNIGLIGSAVASYQRTVTERIEREARPVSRWFGGQGDKVELDLVLQSDLPVEGDYGLRHKYTFATAEGNSVVWWASSGRGIDPGARVALKGTIKGHEEWREVKSTVLTRCKIRVIETAAA